MASKMFNKDKPYSRIIGDRKAKYIQGPHLFNGKFEYVGDVNPAYMDGRKGRAAKNREKRNAVERAVAKLGDLGDPAPKQVIGAMKENAQAQAAEDAAES